MTKKKRYKYSSWRIVADKDGMIWIWHDHKFRIASRKIDEIHEWLVDFVSPGDDIAYVGFKEEDIKVKGKKFLEVYYA